MADYDLVIRNGTVATAADTTGCDIASCPAAFPMLPD